MQGIRLLKDIKCGLIYKEEKGKLWVWSFRKMWIETPVHNSYFNYLRELTKEEKDDFFLGDK